MPLAGSPWCIWQLLQRSAHNWGLQGLCHLRICTALCPLACELILVFFAIGKVDLDMVSSLLKQSACRPPWGAAGYIEMSLASGNISSVQAVDVQVTGSQYIDFLCATRAVPSSSRGLRYGARAYGHVKWPA